MPGVRQQTLFGAPPPAEPDAACGPAPVSDAVAALGARLPPLLRFGTSSWGYSGWVNLVYDRVTSDKALAKSGLTAYSQHPLLRAVGVDRTHYAPMSAAQYRELADQVPEHFRFLAKAHEVLTLARFPRHPRYGAQAGEINGRFLDAAYAAEMVIGPFWEGLGRKAGPLLLQLAPQRLEDLGGARGFADRLGAFLRAQPRGPYLAVEVRNSALLTPQFSDALASARAGPCLLAHPALPDVETQAELLDIKRFPALVLRWMLRRDLDHEAAGAKYAPFDRLQDEDEPTRAAVARLAVAAVTAGRPALIIVNNNAEGSAPRSVVKLAEAVAALLPPAPG